MAPSLIEHYSWTRFWYPWDKQVNYDQNGFVCDPDIEYGQSSNPDLTTLDAMQQSKCLVLLGEPGLGKSTALREHHDQMISESSTTRNFIIWLDLKEIPSDLSLVRQLFDSVTFRSWKQSTERLYLFVDSFDEGLLAIDSLSGFITQEFRKLALPELTNKAVPVESSTTLVDSEQLASTVIGQKNIPLNRLYLRVACRPAIWRQAFSEDFQRVFGKYEVTKMKLAPLRRQDVELAAANSQAQGFVEQVIARKVAKFATRPFTLSALLSLFNKNKALPPETLTIYEEVCRVASAEHGNNRKERLLTRQLNQEQRLQIARRTAALTVLGNKSVIRTDLPIKPLEPEELGADFLYGNDDQSGAQIGIDFGALREVFDTALFSGRAENRVGWDHRSLSEFLAAEYCKRKHIALKDIRKLILVEAAGQKRVAQQLYETVAWLCVFYPALVKTVIKNDPMVLLRSDVLKDNEKIRYQATERYLLRFDREQQFNDEFGADDLARLSNSRLFDQLKPYLSDRKKKPMARKKAMDIAEACKTHDLEPYLLAVAHDKNETVPIRAHAISALGSFGTSASKHQLQDLIHVTKEEDPDNEILGSTLSAIWPDHIAVRELFPVLSPPSDRFYGWYWSFLNKLRDTLPGLLSGSELLFALAWVNGQNHGMDRRDGLQPIANCILMRAWEQLNAPEVLESLSDIALKRIQLHTSIVEESPLDRRAGNNSFASLLSRDTAKRQLLISALIHKLVAIRSEMVAYWLLYGSDQIVQPDDIGWLIEQFRTTTAEEQKAYLEIIQRIPANAENLMLIRAALDTGILPEELRFRVYIDLSSEMAETFRKQYGEMQRYKPIRKLLSPTPAERISTLLERISEGQVAFWSNLTRDLTLEPDSQLYGEEGDDLRKLPGWLKSAPATKDKIVSAAKQFLSIFIPIPKDYWQQTFGHWVIAAYLAIVLIQDEDPEFFEAQNEDFWNRWFGLLLSYRFDQGKQLYSNLFSLVTRLYPGAVLKGLQEVLVPELTDCYFLSRLDDVWIPSIESFLMESIRSGDLSPKCNETILNILLAHGSTDAEALADSMVEQDPDIEKRITAAVALLKNSLNGGESVVWRAIQSSDEMGTKIIQRVSSFGSGVPFANKWSDAGLGELFLWISKKYPYAENETGPAGFVGIADSVRYTRDTLLTNLRSRGTATTISILERARTELNIDWMKWHIVEAKNAAIWSAWKGIEPAEILGLGPKSYVGPRWQTYLTGVFTGFLINILTPSNVSALTRACLIVGTVSLLLALAERQQTKTPWLYPLCLLIPLVLLIFFLFVRFVGF